MGKLSLRKRLWHALTPSARPKGLSSLNLFLGAAILLAVLLAILETEPTLWHWARVFWVAEVSLGVVFALEYAGRIWVAAEAKIETPWRCRLAFVVSPAGLADLVAVISVFFWTGGAGGFLLRLVRLLRLIRVAKLGRFSRAWSEIRRAIVDRREALIISFGLAVVAVLLTATALYFVEGAAQPEAFGSIPRAGWWAVATLTTIGYGDVYPVTALGRVLGSVAAIASIGLVALPAGILAAAFSEAMRGRETPATKPAPQID